MYSRLSQTSSYETIQLNVCIARISSAMNRDMATNRDDLTIAVVAFTLTARRRASERIVLATENVPYYGKGVCNIVWVGRSEGDLQCLQDYVRLL